MEWWWLRKITKNVKKNLDLEGYRMYIFHTKKNEHIFLLTRIAKVRNGKHNEMKMKRKIEHKYIFVFNCLEIINFILLLHLLLLNYIYLCCRRECCRCFCCWYWRWMCSDGGRPRPGEGDTGRWKIILKIELYFMETVSATRGRCGQDRYIRDCLLLSRCNDDKLVVELHGWRFGI